MSTPSLGTANGTVPHVPDPPDPLDAIVATLEEQLAPLAARRSQLESEIADVLSKERRIKAGIAALQSPAPKGPKKSATTRDKHDWSPSQKTLDDVYATLARSEEPMTCSALAESTGVSRATVTKAIDVLREQERVRLMGQAPSPGSPKVYGPMT